MRTNITKLIWKHVHPLPTAATVTVSFIGKINIKINKGGISSEIVSVFYLYMFCKFRKFQARCKLALIFVAFVFLWLGRDWPRGSLWCWDTFRKALGTPRARQVLGMQIQINSRMQFHSVLSVFPTKPQTLWDTLFLEAPWPNHLQTINTSLQFYRFPNYNRSNTNTGKVYLPYNMWNPLSLPIFLSNWQHSNSGHWLATTFCNQQLLRH